jgi:hypothetical protein
MGVKEEFLRLLKEDEEFRLAAASLLGYIELIKRLDENEKRIDSTLAEIKKLREDFNREMHNLREDFNREVQKLREDFNREMHNLREEQIKMREEFNRLEHRFEVILGRMGRRWGVDLEKTMLGTFKEVLERRVSK